MQPASSATSPAPACAPEFDGVIAFNGSARHRENLQPFLISPTVPDAGRDPYLAYGYASTGFVARHCDTDRASYDLAVAAVLLRCHQLAPTAFAISSDGGWLVEWQHGAHVWADGLAPDPAPPLPVAARSVVIELFGNVQTQCPFASDGPDERDPLPDHTEH